MTKELERKRAREEIVNDYIGATSFSWTWARLTDEEIELFKRWLHADRFIDTLRGTDYQRWDVMNNYYFMFLLGLGYGKDERFKP